MSEPSEIEEMLVDEGWRAADVDPSELVDDEWIARNTRKGRKPSKVKAAGRKLIPGTYILRMTATNANGRSEQVKIKFWVLRTKR